MDIAATIIGLLSLRSPNASICPSEVARALAVGDAAWRALMPSVRESAAKLACAGCIVITQGDRQVNPDDVASGPIRLRRGPAFPESGIG